MRVLWFCSRPIEAADLGQSGTWQAAMANALIENDDIELCVIATGRVAVVGRHDYRRVRQWVVPVADVPRRDGLPSASLVDQVRRVVDDACPDVIHTWGTEGFWGLFTARRLVAAPALLEIQGLKGGLADVFCGDLSWHERVACIGPKEVLKRRTMRADQREFAAWGIYEQEMIRGHRFIDVQSPFVRECVNRINPAANVFQVDRPLRQPFYASESWQHTGDPVLFCSAAYTAPFKGLHVAIRALGLLARRVPGVRLRIAGPHQRSGLRQDGYVRWLNRLIRRLGLSARVQWLGPLDANHVAAELQRAACMLVPSFSETYCVAAAEAMSVGTPLVTTRTGGTTHLVSDEDTGLFFSPGDAISCASQLERVLADAALARRLSTRARAAALARHDRGRIARRQLEIYREVRHRGETLVRMRHQETSVGEESERARVSDDV